MKVMFASTTEQEKKIEELIQHLYASIFPQYFDDEEIESFMKLKVLQVETELEERFATLVYSYKAIASLQVIIDILGQPHDCKFTCLFNKNVKILEDIGIFFPFHYNNFKKNKDEKFLTPFSVYSSPSNQLLI